MRELSNDEKKELGQILKERYLSNRNLDSMETICDCIDTDFFGFGSFKKFKKAHKNNYKAYTLGAFFETLSDGGDNKYFLSNIDNCIFTKGKYINFSYNELKFILQEFDFEIDNISLATNEDSETVEVYIELLNSKDTEEILNLQKKRLSKIEQINEELERLQALKESL